LLVQPAQEPFFALRAWTMPRPHAKKPGTRPGFKVAAKPLPRTNPRDQWNCSSSVEPDSALTLDEPPWITVVTSSK
jgi:hypothetical protein